MAETQTTGAIESLPAQPEKMPPMVIKASVITNDKHVAIIIQDAEAVAEVAAGLTGHPELAAAIKLIGDLAAKAVSGYEDAGLIEITPENIEKLLFNVPLVKPKVA